MAKTEVTYFCYLCRRPARMVLSVAAIGVPTPSPRWEPVCEEHNPLRKDVRAPLAESDALAWQKERATLLARTEAAERRVVALTEALEGASAYIERCWYHDDKRSPNAAGKDEWLRELIREPIRAALAAPAPGAAGDDSSAT